LEFEEMTPLDEERVLTTQRWVGHFRHTGIPIDGSWASVITVRDGRIVHAVGYLTKKQAVRASGADLSRRSSLPQRWATTMDRRSAASSRKGARAQHRSGLLELVLSRRQPQAVQDARFGGARGSCSCRSDPRNAASSP
jgi:hypothetical protein